MFQMLHIFIIQCKQNFPCLLKEASRCYYKKNTQHSIKFKKLVVRPVQIRNTKGKNKKSSVILIKKNT